MLSKETIEKNATQLLKKAKIGRMPVDLYKVAKHINNMDSHLDKITITMESFPNHISGVMFREGDILFIGINKKHKKNRQRFTIAHEIGHYIFHTEDALHFDDENLEDITHFRANQVSTQDEREANQFAAALLMPEKHIEKFIEKSILSVQELAKCFEVSEEAMRYRLIHLGLL